MNCHKEDAVNWNKCLGITLTAILTFSAVANAEQHLSGEVTGVLQAAHNPFYIDGDISVPQNSSLTIEPGVLITVSGNYRINVQGTLIASGTERDSIKISAAAGQRNSWVGITLSGAFSDRSVVSYVSIRHAYRGIVLDDSDPVIMRCSITDCDNSAVRFVRSNGKLYDCRIANINSSGVAVVDNSVARIERDTIRNCGDSGVTVGNGGRALVIGNFIETVQDHGISISSGATLTLCSLNVIRNVGVRGISIDQTNSVKLYRNVVHRTTSGAGVFVFRSTGIDMVFNTILSAGQYGVQWSSSSGGNCINTIIAESGRSGLFVSQSNVNARYNDYYNNARDYEGINAGEGDLAQYPEKVNPDLANYWPRQNSPMVDRGDPNYADPDATQSDIGAYFFNQNHPPVIQRWEPVTLTEAPGDSAITFRIVATDPDGHGLTYYWYINGVLDNRRPESFAKIFNRDGRYVVRGLVSDYYYLGTADHIWEFEVRGASVLPDRPLPEGCRVSEVYPNPFNGNPKIDFETPQAGKVEVELWDISGRFAGRIFSGDIGAGRTTLVLPSHRHPTGRYTLAVKFGGGVVTRNLALVK